jgi:hypothetical protein
VKQKIPSRAKIFDRPSMTTSGARTARKKGLGLPSSDTRAAIPPRMRVRFEKQK